MKPMRCDCGGAIDCFWTCSKCGEVHDEPVQKIKRMMKSREDEREKPKKGQ